MEMITVNANGQVTLPAKARKSLGFAPGSSLCVVRREDGLLLRKATPVSEDVFAKIRKMADAKGLTEKDVVKMCREIRKEIYREEYGE